MKGDKKNKKKRKLLSSDAESSHGNASDSSRPIGSNDATSAGLSDTLDDLEARAQVRKWETFIIDPRSDRKAFLLNFPLAMQDFVNTAKLLELERLFDELCSPDCTIRTRLMSESPGGKEKLVELFASIHRSVPDYTMIMTQCNLSLPRRVLTVDCKSTGTKLYNDSSEYFYNTINYGPVGVIDESLRYAALKIEQQGGNYAFKADVQFQFVLDSEKMHAIKIIVSTNVTDVDAVHPDLLHQS